MNRSNRKSSRAQRVFRLKQLAVVMVIGGLVLALLTYLGYRINTSEKTLIHLSFFPILAGLVFEYRRISSKWSTVWWTTLGAFVTSFAAFLPGRGERNYILETHIQIWPYAFLILFTIIVIAFHEKDITAQLTEGITLLQSVAIVYWILDHGFWNDESIVIKGLMIIGILFSLFSVFHAFSTMPLTKTIRLTLSIWSSIIMVLLAVENIYTVYQNGEFETASDLMQGSYIFLQYFLLGISGIYIAHNFLMLLLFIPGKGSLFNGEYGRDLRMLKEAHIERFSSYQVHWYDSAICVIVAAGIFGLNYYFDFVPRNFIIWLVFAISPLVLFLYYGLIRKK